MEQEQLEKSFTGRDDRGRPVKVNVYAASIVTTGSESGGGVERRSTTRRIATSDGRRLNRIAKGVYEIAGGGGRVTSDAPEAP
jgi:hypothetical protein